MNWKNWKSLLVMGIILTVLLAGCAQTEKPQGENQATQTQKSVTIIGSGATFPQPQVEKWIGIYSKINPNVRIEYTGKGSGGGQNDFKQGLVDFACSDPPLKESLWKELEKKGKPLQFPIIVGAVVIAYNVPEVSELKLSGEVIADIFMGKIEYWDDEAIKSLNPGANLPHKKITVVHRSDSSGTTDIFTNYLAVVSKEWDEKVGAGKTVDWPVDKLGRGVGGKGNPGVVAVIKSTPYSIGYTELAYAYKENLKTVAIKNKDGNFVKASENSIKEAVVSLNVPPPDKGYMENVRAFMNAPGKDSYPIVAFSHMVIWRNYPDLTKEDEIKRLVKWILTNGQKSENVVSGYVGLPEELTSKLINELNI